MKRLFAALGLLLLAFVRDTPNAAACGGPDVYYPLVVAPLRLGSRGDEDDWQRDAFFLYPYWVAHPKEADLLWKVSYESQSSVPAPDMAPFDRAVAAKAPAAALAAARQLIDDWYGLPPVPAARHRNDLLRAVVYIENGSATAMSATSASGRFLAIMDELAREVPDGWSAGTKRATPAPIWAKQLRETDAWRAQNPQHPLYDLVGFWQVRVDYLSGDFEKAWSRLFSFYGRRRTRALAEMRYLFYVGHPPSPAQIDSLKDPLLVALFVDSQSATPARAERWWRLAEKSSDRGESLALQERLLAALVLQPASKPLPRWFPKRPEMRSQYWGRARAEALMQHSRFAEALAQLEPLEPERDQAGLLASCRLALGQPLAAIGTAGLTGWDPHYLMLTRVPRSEAAKHLTDANPVIRNEAARAAELELIRQRDYAGAAKLIASVDEAEAEDLKGLAALQRQGDTLGLARALRAHKQSLAVGADPGFYRGLSVELAALPPTSVSAQHISQYLEDSSGSFEALRLLVQWLEAHPGAANAHSVLQDADGAYNDLINYGSWGDLFWQRRLKDDDLTRRLRSVGKLVRSAKP